MGNIRISLIDRASGHERESCSGGRCLAGNGATAHVAHRSPNGRKLCEARRCPGVQRTDRARGRRHHRGAFACIAADSGGARGVSRPGFGRLENASYEKSETTSESAALLILRKLRETPVKSGTCHEDEPALPQKKRG